MVSRCKILLPLKIVVVSMKVTIGTPGASYTGSSSLGSVKVVVCAMASQIVALESVEPQTFPDLRTNLRTKILLGNCRILVSLFVVIVTAEQLARLTQRQEPVEEIQHAQAGLVYGVSAVRRPQPMSNLRRQVLRPRRRTILSRI